MDKDNIIEGINTAVRVVRDYRKIRGEFWFSVAKRNLKSLDHVGKASGQDFRLVPLEDLLNFVRWDMHFNNLFVVWGFTIRQQEKGVPIGGFLSAQLMCLCLLGIEYQFVENANRHDMLCPALQKWPKDFQCPVLLCGMSLSFPFTAFVPRNTNLFHESGMDGWFSQDRHLLFRAQFESFCLPFYAPGLWDSHLEGRVGKIIDTSLAKQRPFLASYFNLFNQSNA